MNKKFNYKIVQNQEVGNSNQECPHRRQTQIQSEFNQK